METGIQIERSQAWKNWSRDTIFQQVSPFSRTKFIHSSFANLIEGVIDSQISRTNAAEPDLSIPN